MPKYMKSSVRQQPEVRKEATHDEAGKAEKKLVICTRCHEARIGKKWRSAASLLAKNLTAHKEGVHFTLCPACTMITKKLYEGEIVIGGVSPEREAELLHMIASFGARAQEIDPQDRIIAIEHTKKGELRITTTENQLAQKIAKKIKSSFKKTTMHIGYSSEPYQVTRIQMQFPA
jgi:NMD protein affecting ribosome stability and mRNA decay